MIFIIASTKKAMPPNSILFIIDNWDDYSYKTSFYGYYYNSNKEEYELGSIKIAKENMSHGRVIDFALPQSFKSLPNEFYSLWQSADSYQTIRDIEKNTGESIFKALNDIAFDLKSFKKHKTESVCQHSLLRSVSDFTCKKQFHRIAIGYEKKIDYRFDYVISNNNSTDNTTLSFNVTPDIMPPSNVHVLIGRNGTGKTNLIRNMITSIYDNNKLDKGFQYPESTEDDIELGHFESILCVAFSPFDDFSSLDKFSEKKEPNYSYIGLKKKYSQPKSERSEDEISLLNYIKEQFMSSFKSCCGNKTKTNDLIEMMELLSSDPLFSTYDLKDMIFEQCNDNQSNIDNVFMSLSSGHKVVLSIITCCVDKLAEKTILFMDEPENHLHPPLISALIRGISILLYKRNGVGIISTHSPVILQEVPKNCVWIINRNGDYTSAKRPSLETFGTNVGTLINEIFGYEVQNSGFHLLLKNIVKESDSYEDVNEKFQYMLGDEAKSIVRMMFDEKERGVL